MPEPRPAPWSLQWVQPPLDASTREGLHDLVSAVAGLGGAVGWLRVPSRPESDAWVDGLLAAGARLVLARAGPQDAGGAGAVLGCGSWQRLPAAVTRQNAEVRRVMTLPSARGRGIARAVVQGLVADADRAGVEVITLSSRGNNHAALGLYADLGFVVSGRRPDWIAVGDERFDEVLLHRDLRPPRGADGLLRRGGRRTGPGSS